MKLTRPARDHVATASPDIRAEQIAQLKQLFPEVVAEGKIDFDKLRALLGDAVDSRPERYSFTWAGKRDAIRALQTPSEATLVPAPDESVNFDTTRNLFIEGDNLEVLKLLHKSYFGRIKMIYIDPPYNTGNDFIYPDDFAHPLRRYLELTGQRDTSGNLLTTNPETSGRYHSAWLSMMYPRLVLSRLLLRDDGVLMVSIDDHEVYTLRMLLNEVFGEERFLGAFVWRRRSGAMDATNGISIDHEYILCYGKAVRGQRRTFERYANPDNDPRGPWVADNLSAAKPGGDTWYPIEDPTTGRQFWPPKGRYWPYNPEVMRRKVAENRILFPKGQGGAPLLKRFQAEAKSLIRPISSWIASIGDSVSGPERLSSAINSEGTREIKELFADKVFLYPKPVSLLRALIEQGTGDLSGPDKREGSDEQDLIVLDFFAGSATTAQAVLELNHQDHKSRRFILVQLPEPTGNTEYPTIAEIAKERIRRVVSKLNGTNDGKKPLFADDTPEDLGVRVFKLAPSQTHQWRGVQASDDTSYVQMLADFTRPVGNNAFPLYTIWEVALREGYGLTSQIGHIAAVTGQTVYRVADCDKNQSFTICLDDTLRLDALRPLRLTKDDLFVCRDSALDDTTAANLALQCRLRTV